MNLFGRRKAASSTPSAPSGGGGESMKDALATMQTAVDQLTKREDHLERKVQHELAEVKKFMAAKNKRAALAALKRKKLIESQLEKVTAYKTTLEVQQMTLQGAITSKTAFQAMGIGARALERQNKEMSTDVVEETMDDLQEQMGLQNETAEALARTLATGIGDDEDELLQELEALEQETLDEHILKIDTAAEQPAAFAAPSAPVSRPLPAMPSAPTTKVQETAEERELRELTESMAM